MSSALPQQHSREKTRRIIQDIQRIIPEEEYRQKKAGFFLSPADIGYKDESPCSFGISHPFTSGAVEAEPMTRYLRDLGSLAF